MTMDDVVSTAESVRLKLAGELAVPALIGLIALKVGYDVFYRPQSQVSAESAKLAGHGDMTINQLKHDLKRMEQLRQEERTGRIRAEKQLKQLVTQDKQPSDDRSFASASAFSFEAVGYVESPFRDRRGTPRQPQLAPSIPGFIRINRKFQPSDSLKGLEDFSHLWVTFVFHNNTNMHRAGSANTMACKAMVQPPALNGQKVGCFACRSPHRPNAIGLSLVKLVAVTSDGIHIAGHDLLDGTPVIDVKPYLPHVEAIPEASMPNWVAQPRQLLLSTPVWSDDATATLLELHPQGADLLRRHIDELLRFDIRNAKQREASTDTIYELVYDQWQLLYRIDEQRACVVKIGHKE
eukprot:TRINITY_DN1905_c0_g1_i1.p1 TRINITY_DN1905_c0_g1~~TRINITY_DN1905_c0_g1_i1.p1  ORF type:complete len:351 (+),score=62.82 TRINITY_DN1905_c0_g1_i1:331-1383(+)